MGAGGSRLGIVSDERLRADVAVQLHVARVAKKKQVKGQQGSIGANAAKSNRAQLQLLFDRTDANRDGVVDFGDFARAAADLGIKATETQLRVAFSRFDGDKDGAIQCKEFVNFMCPLVGLEIQGQKNLKGQPGTSPPQTLGSTFAITSMKVPAESLGRTPSAMLQPQQQQTVGSISQGSMSARASVAASVKGAAVSLAGALFAGERSIQQVFQKWDVDGNGALEAPDLGDSLHGLGFGSNAAASSLLHVLDTECDGRVSSWGLVRALEDVRLAGTAPRGQDAASTLHAGYSQPLEAMSGVEEEQAYGRESLWKGAPEWDANTRSELHRVQEGRRLGESHSTLDFSLSKGRSGRSALYKVEGVASQVSHAEVAATSRRPLGLRKASRSGEKLGDTSDGKDWRGKDDADNSQGGKINCEVLAQDSLPLGANITLSGSEMAKAARANDVVAVEVANASEQTPKLPQKPLDLDEAAKVSPVSTGVHVAWTDTASGDVGHARSDSAVLLAQVEVEVRRAEADATTAQKETCTAQDGKEGRASAQGGPQGLPASLDRKDDGNTSSETDAVRTTCAEGGEATWRALATSLGEDACAKLETAAISNAPKEATSKVGETPVTFVESHPKDGAAAQADAEIRKVSDEDFPDAEAQAAQGAERAARRWDAEGQAGATGRGKSSEEADKRGVNASSVRGQDQEASAPESRAAGSRPAGRVKLEASPEGEERRPDAPKSSSPRAAPQAASKAAQSARAAAPRQSSASPGAPSEPPGRPGEAEAPRAPAAEAAAKELSLNPGATAKETGSKDVRRAGSEAERGSGSAGRANKQARKGEDQPKEREALPSEAVQQKLRLEDTAKAQGAEQKLQGSKVEVQAGVAVREYGPLARQDTTSGEAGAARAPASAWPAGRDEEQREAREPAALPPEAGAYEDGRPHRPERGAKKADGEPTQGADEQTLRLAARTERGAEDEGQRKRPSRQASHATQGGACGADTSPPLPSPERPGKKQQQSPPPWKPEEGGGEAAVLQSRLAAASRTGEGKPKTTTDAGGDFQMQLEDPSSHTKMAAVLFRQPMLGKAAGSASNEMDSEQGSPSRSEPEKANINPQGAGKILASGREGMPKLQKKAQLMPEDVGVEIEGAASSVGDSKQESRKERTEEALVKAAADVWGEREGSRTRRLGFQEDVRRSAEELAPAKGSAQGEARDALKSAKDEASHLGDAPKQGPRGSPKLATSSLSGSLTCKTELGDLASCAWKMKPIGEAMGDEEVFAALRKRIRCLRATAVDALAQCTQKPAAGMQSSLAGLLLVTPDVLVAFAAQLRFDLPPDRAAQLLLRAGEVAEAAGVQSRHTARGPSGKAALPVSEFLALLTEGEPEGDGAPPANPEEPRKLQATHKAARPVSEVLALLTEGGLEVCGAPSSNRDDPRQLHATYKAALPVSEFLALLTEGEREGDGAPSANPDEPRKLQTKHKALQGAAKDLGTEGHELLVKLRDALSGGYASVQAKREMVSEVPGAKAMAAGRGAPGRYGSGAAGPEAEVSSMQGAGGLRRWIPEACRVSGPDESLNFIRAAAGVRGQGKGAQDLGLVQGIFRRWDADGDGTISEQDLFKVLQVLDHRFTMEGVRKLFCAADVNKDGVIDWKEFTAWLFR